MQRTGGFVQRIVENFMKLEKFSDVCNLPPRLLLYIDRSRLSREVTPLTDNEILDLFFARSEGAIPALQERYGAYCGAIVRRLLTDERDAEECLSDCWLTVWNTVPPTRPEHLKGWLGAVARNRALAMGRENGRRPDTVDETALELAVCLPCREEVQGELLAKELGDAVSEFLRKQKPDRRTAFLRRYWYLDSVEETAAHLGWTVSKTKSVLFRMRNSLWDYLNKEGLL